VKENLEIGALQRQRYREWLLRAREWVFGDSEVAGEIGPYLILVHSSMGNIERYVLPKLSEVETFGPFVQGAGSARGNYQETDIWLLHHMMGCTATQMWMQCLEGTGVKYIISLGEMTSYPADVLIGDIVVPSTSERGDLIGSHRVPPEIPAAADPQLLYAAVDHFDEVNWPIHFGEIYSGMPGGVGVDNPILKEKIFQGIQSHQLGNAIETSIVYLEAARLGIQALDLWVVSDDIAYGVFDDYPGGKDRWIRGWDLISSAALDILSGMAGGHHDISE
jgi:purine-nucleoside phosphorylase